MAVLFSGVLNQTVALGESRDNSNDFANAWVTSEGIKLQAIISTSSNASTARELSVLRSGKVIFKYQTKFLYSYSLTNLDSGNLATEWTEGLGSVHHLIVFGFTHNKVIEVLHISSNGLFPEFVYLQTGSLLRTPANSRSEKATTLDEDPTQSIIAPITDWVIVPSTGERKLIPVRADIYTWNKRTTRYDSLKGIPWEKRLNPLKLSQVTSSPDYLCT